VVAEDVKTPKVIVKGKGKKTDVSRAGGRPEVRKIPEFIVFNNMVFTVEVEGIGKCAGVDKKGSYGYKGKGNGEAVSSR
jgi:hypothetical protein